jgi:hypothetical protein
VAVLREEQQVAVLQQGLHSTWFIKIFIFIIFCFKNA